jgi:hypothetical protein
VNPINSYRIRFTGIFIITALRFGFTSSDIVLGTQPGTAKVLLLNFVLALLTAVVTWEANRALIIYCHRAFAAADMERKRFVTEALLVIIVNAFIYCVTIALLFYFDPQNRPHWLFLFLGMLDRLLYGFLIAGFYELLFFMQKWKTATREAEELKKLNLMIQFESLKNQVKPHFLFNSLNTLTGLVEKDSKQAVKFIAELSKVYRYLLQSSEKELIGLQDELQFTEAYFFLLQTRFGEGIALHINVHENIHQQLLPPLTLQMLVENAVKHNQVSVRKPLKVEIFSEDDQWLIVRNNFQPRRGAASNGMGLSNIASKYRLLNQPEMSIENDEHSFTVKLPLIKPATV